MPALDLEVKIPNQNLTAQTSLNTATISNKK